MSSKRKPKNKASPQSPSSPTALSASNLARLEQELLDEEDTITTELTELRSPRHADGTLPTDTQTDLELGEGDLSDTDITLDEETRNVLATLDDPKLAKLLKIKPTGRGAASDGAGVEDAPAPVRTSSRAQIAKKLLDRKELEKQLHLRSIEVAKISHELATERQHHQEDVEAMREQMQTMRFQSDGQRAKLEAEIAVLKEDARRRQDQWNKERELIATKQQELETMNAQLAEHTYRSKSQFIQDIDINEDQFYELQAKPEHEVTLREFVAMRLFAKMQPILRENAELRQRTSLTDEQNLAYSEKLIRLQELLDMEKRQHAELNVKHQRDALELIECKKQVQVGNYKIENFDQVKTQRDQFEADLADARSRLQFTETAFENAIKDRDEARHELAGLRQAHGLLISDKDYLTKQVFELQRRADAAEERTRNSQMQLDKMRAQREELFERYTHARDEYKAHFERKLSDELDELRNRTQLEIERLRAQEKQVHESEANTLRDQREHALQERDRARSSERDSLDKYEQLAQKHRELEASLDQRVAELVQDLKLKSFEHDRLHLVHEETLQDLKKLQLDHEKQRAKLDAVLKEFGALQMESEGRIRELERTLDEKKEKLRIYEKMETEMDQLVMDAAQIDDPALAERILANYGSSSSNLPSMQRRRLQQSVELARRVLQLERTSARGRQELQAARDRVSELEQQLQSSSALLDEARQPNSYLIDSLRDRDAQIAKLKKRLQALEHELRQVERERADLFLIRNQMAQDMDRLLNYAQDVQELKKLLQNIPTRDRATPIPRAEVDASGASVLLPPQNPPFVSYSKARMALSSQEVSPHSIPAYSGIHSMEGASRDVVPTPTRDQPYRLPNSTSPFLPPHSAYAVVNEPPRSFA